MRNKSLTPYALISDGSLIRIGLLLSLAAHT